MNLASVNCICVPGKMSTNVRIANSSSVVRAFMRYATNAKSPALNWVCSVRVLKEIEPLFLVLLPVLSDVAAALKEK